MLAARPEDGAVHFVVTDQGPGLDASEVARVFDRLWQAKRSAHAGLGLGLAIARDLIQAHAGRIWAESTPGHGSTFHFTLPGAGTGEAGDHAPAPRPRA